jgi:DNA-directed RNA polymerase specialized sigma24 family protein
MKIGAKIFDMKIPSGMTEKQVLDKIDVVVNRTSAKYTFYGYQVEDIKQEAFIICLEAMERYEEGKPLENFLAVNLSNRLKNLVRDNLFKKDDHDFKKAIKMPEQLDGTHQNAFYFECETERLNVKDLAIIIDEKLPTKYRANYLKMINGIHINKKEKEELIEVIKEIAEENGYSE